jgi:hypothetical protein
MKREHELIMHRLYRYYMPLHYITVWTACHQNDADYNQFFTLVEV